MLTGLDPHSTYLDKKAFKDLREGTRGEFGGLGIEVGMEDGFVKVITPIDDTPAFKAGIEAGDLVIRLDEKPVNYLLFWRIILGQYLNLVGQIRPGPPWKMPSRTPMF